MEKDIVKIKKYTRKDIVVRQNLKTRWSLDKKKPLSDDLKDCYLWYLSFNVMRTCSNGWCS